MIRLADERLCALAQGGNSRALDELLRRHERRVLVAAARYYWPGADRDDVRQEARLALYQAVLLYDPSASSFLTFSRLVIDRALVECLRRARRGKHRVFDDALRVARDADDGLVQVVDLLPACDGDPARTLAAREELARLARAMSTLTPLEQEWFRFALNGGAYSANVGGRRNKRVENAVERARDKLRRAA